MIIALALVGAGLATVDARNVDANGDVVVAVIDTGVRATHVEFDYPNDATGPAGQFVAWWDFTDEKGAVQLPDSGDTWDARHAPYDTHGHGTGTAARVGGETVSMAPGAKLAIAKVGDASGSLMNIRAAYEWAVNEVNADIVSFSIGTVTPWIGADSLNSAMRDAHRDGVLTVTSAGNGMGNACGPTMSWMHGYGYNRDVLSVGSAFPSGNPSVLFTCSSMHPDISSHGYSVKIPCPDADDCYRTSSGTSYSAPYVAGAAAVLLEEFLDAGAEHGPTALKDLVKSCAWDTLWPHAFEGQGFFGPDQFERARPHAQSGTLCDRDRSWFAEGTAVQNDVFEEVSDWGRWTFSDALGFRGQTLVRAADASTNAGIMGTSAPAGLVQMDTYEVDLDFGDSATVDLDWDLSDGTTDLDLYVLPPSAGDDVIRLSEAVARSTQAAGNAESLVVNAMETGTYRVLVLGWLVPGDMPYTLDADGATFVDAGLYTGQATI